VLAAMYSRRYVILVLMVLIGATAAAHFPALWDGWFLDDHWHRRQYMDNQWSLAALLDATTIKPDRFMDTWWQEKPIQWQYIRPVSILVAKVVYHLSGGSVKALHAVSLLLHLANALMVQHLCLRLTRKRFWAIVGALLFVVYSHSVYAVAWLASQNAVLQVTLTLAALLCYARASGLDLYAAPAPGTATPRDGHLPERPSISTSMGGIFSWPWFVAAMLLWVLALGCRENAIVLPVFAAAFDLAFGGKRHLRARLPGLAFMAILAGAFAAWRLLLHYEPMPDFYFRRPDGPGYVLWWLVKLMHYVTSAIWLSPMTVGPTGRLNPVTEVPGDCLLMLAILAILGTGYYQACRRLRGWWIWPLWILLAFLPVVPVMATPHSGYMPGVAFAVAMVLGAALREHAAPTGIGRWSRPVAIWFLIATTTYMPIYRTMWRSVLAAERWTAQEVAATAGPNEATDVFLINLPFVNIYLKYQLQEEWADGRDALLPVTAPNLRCHVLTYADNVLRMEESCRLEQIDERTFTLSCNGRGYFSGALGRFLVEGMRSGRQFHSGQEIHGEQALFDARIVRADGQGVQEIQFRFHEPLATGRYLFYITTGDRAATRVRFWGPQGPPADSPLQVGEADDALVVRKANDLRAGSAQAAEGLFSAMAAADAGLRQKAWDAFREVARPVAQGLAAPVRDDLAPGLPETPVLARIRQWWTRSVDDRIMRQLWLERQRFRHWQRERDRLFQIREVAGWIIRTDLYLTGPPYPGPK
jgi:hypothetical protein